MTDQQVIRWYRDHLQSFAPSENDMRIATFKVNGQRIEIPIPESLWQYVLVDYGRMAKLRRAVMNRVIREQELS